LSNSSKIFSTSSNTILSVFTQSEVLEEFGLAIMELLEVTYLDEILDHFACICRHDIVMIVAFFPGFKLIFLLHALRLETGKHEWHGNGTFTNLPSKASV
jgi:hypothetical protein